MWWGKKPEKFWHQMDDAERLVWLYQRMWSGKWFEIYVQRSDRSLERYKVRIWRDGIEQGTDDPMICLDYQEDAWALDSLAWKRGNYFIRLSKIYHASKRIGPRA